MSEGVHSDVKDYYGKRVKATDDLLTNVCTVGSATFSRQAKEAMKLVHPDVMAKNYGCGAVYPEAVDGCAVLDLGSGAGIDCFVLSKLVGQSGRVVGVDMTKEQLDIARKHISYHTEKFGYSEPNVEFREGYIENLGAAGIKDQTFDLVISNCVVNLSPDKPAVLREAFRVLKPGGEMYFSDVYSNQAIPEVLRKNKVLWGECLSGALQWQELVEIATEIGFAPPILVTSITFQNDSTKIKESLASAGASELKFCSATYRLIKPEKQVEEDSSSIVRVTYRGTIEGYEDGVQFSVHGLLQKEMPVSMASSTAALLQGIPRLAPHFTISDPVDCLEGRPKFPDLSVFRKIDPFAVASKSQVIDSPDSLSDGGKGCCGQSAKKSCC